MSKGKQERKFIMNDNFIITGFADEISSVVTEQFEHLNKLGIEYFEPRGIDEKNISDLNDEDVKVLKEKMQKLNALTI